MRRFLCKTCGKGFSLATIHPCYRQKKRQINEPLRKLYCSVVSQRRAAKILNISRTTAARKFLFLAAQAEFNFHQSNFTKPLATAIQFDDLETMEHTKLKPLSVTLAVETGTRRILGFEVATMPAKGALARRSYRKYGRRPDGRRAARHTLFKTLKTLVQETATIQSDQNPHYPADVKLFFPKATHEAFKGQRGSIVGQGELKKIRWDPLFSLNHTCAMFRANVNRLLRKTWCTTKKQECLRAHLYLYANYHNEELIKPAEEAVKAVLEKGEKRFVVNETLWKKLSPVQKAGMLTHEIIYEHFAALGETDSGRARRLNAHLYSPKIESQTSGQFWQMIKEFRIPLYP